MGFQFIDNNTSIGPDARRRIRCHAASGKNVGRTITRPSKKKARELDCKTAATSANALQISTASPQEIGRLLERQLDDGVSLLALPADVSQEPPGLVHKGDYSFHVFMPAN